MRQLCRRDLAYGDGFTMKEFSIARTVFNRVTDGVAEIQNSAQATFRFVLAYDIRLDFATARDDVGQRGGIPTQEFRQVAL